MPLLADALLSHPTTPPPTFGIVNSISKENRPVAVSGEARNPAAEFKAGPKADWLIAGLPLMTGRQPETRSVKPFTPNGKQKVSPGGARAGSISTGQLGAWVGFHWRGNAEVARRTIAIQITSSRRFCAAVDRCWCSSPAAPRPGCSGFAP